MAYLRYSPVIERIATDEQATIDGRGHDPGRKPSRSAEAIPTASAMPKALPASWGRWRFRADLPPEPAQGLFARKGIFPVAICFAQGPGEMLGNRVSTYRGMAIKVFGAEGERLRGHDVPVQNFVLSTGATFASGTDKGFLRNGILITKAAALPEGAKSWVSALAHNLNRMLRTVRTESAMAEFFGHPFSHRFIDSYFSQAPMRWGDYVAKIGAFPASVAQGALRD